ncbi:MAG: hypothetical protein GF370_04540 [Candidatus Nealsonbacteria bacterium]|nr:hypothetical protein [Candidatus Nealsonbacteria bacterium]
MNSLVSWGCKIFLAPLVRLLLIKEVRGQENIPDSNFILATNHQSHLDEIANGYVCVPRKFRFIGQTDNYGGLTKLLLYIVYFLAGVIHLNREEESSKKRALQEAVESLKNGNIVVIYPEGTRTRTGKLGKGKWGVAKMFLKTGVPVLPAAITGTFKLLPPGGDLQIRRIIRINIGKPLAFKEEFEKAKRKDLNKEEKEQLLVDITERVMKEIAILKKDLKKEQ